MQAPVSAAAPLFGLHVASADTSFKLVATAAPIAGTLAEAHFYSVTLGSDMTYCVYLPTDYATSGTNYPVVYMLHGAGGSFTEWSDSFLTDRTDEMISTP